MPVITPELWNSYARVTGEQIKSRSLWLNAKIVEAIKAEINDKPIAASLWNDIHRDAKNIAAIARVRAEIAAAHIGE